MKNVTFGRRVHVYALGGARLLRTVPPVEAARLLKGGAKSRHPKGHQIREIEVPDLTGRIIGPATAPQIRNYMGQKYTRREVLTNAAGEVCGHMVDMRRIHHDDQDLFLLSITDCGGQLVRRQVRYDK